MEASQERHQAQAATNYICRIRSPLLDLGVIVVYIIFFYLKLDFIFLIENHKFYEFGEWKHLGLFVLEIIRIGW